MQEAVAAGEEAVAFPDWEERVRAILPFLEQVILMAETMNRTTAPMAAAAAMVGMEDRAVMAAEAQADLRLGSCARVDRIRNS
jgi:hypothetical protein